MCWTARYQDTAKRSWEIYPIGFLVPWSASCSDKNPRCNELQLGMVHELLVQGLCCNFWYGTEGEGLWKFFWHLMEGSIAFFCAHVWCPCSVQYLHVLQFFLLGWRSLFVLTLSYSVLEIVQGFDGANGVCQKADGEARRWVSFAYAWRV